MGDIGTPELLIIVLVVVVLFGSKKLPDAARSIGRSLRIFKSEIKGMHDDAAPPAPPAATTAPAQVSPPTATGGAQPTTPPLQTPPVQAPVTVAAPGTVDHGSSNGRPTEVG